VPCSGTDCEACSVVSLINNVMGFILGLSIPIAILLFAYAGALYFTSAAKEENIGQAKKIFSSAIIGLLVAISAYLVVDTLMHAILSPQYWSGWNKITCVGIQNRPMDKKITDLFSEVTLTYTQGPQVVGGVGDTKAGAVVTMQVKDANGNLQTITFTTNRSTNDLVQGYNNALKNYGSQVNVACAAYGASIPDCSTKVLSIMSIEGSGSNPGCNSVNACGPMQVIAGTGLNGCDVNDIACNINSGVNELNQNMQLYGGNLINSVAAYNGGTGSTPGSLTGGKTPAMAPSHDCTGLLAYQCTTNPGGLVETQNYIADYCTLLGAQGSSCN
jgi:hypothetical protein